MTAREIAEKYVFGRHDALTDNQEIEDMIKDIEEFAKVEQNKCDHLFTTENKSGNNSGNSIAICTKCGYKP